MYILCKYSFNNIFGLYLSKVFFLKEFVFFFLRILFKLFPLKFVRQEHTTNKGNSRKIFVRKINHKLHEELYKVILFSPIFSLKYAQRLKFKVMIETFCFTADTFHTVDIY